MHIEIHSLQSTLFDGTAEKLICATPQGQITILDNHLPLITKVVGPVVKVVDNKGEGVRIDLTSGILEVRPESRIVLLVDQ